MRQLAALLLILSLAACGMKPLYGTGSDQTRADLAAIEVAEIPGRAGWLMRNALSDRLSANGSASPRYRLDVRLDDELEGLGLLSDESIGRERRTLRARYQLVDLASDDIVLDASAEYDAGIDVVSSDYATIAAEETALENLAVEVADRIVTRVALALRDQE
jgi:LPS-assembly lipoprotein